MSHRKWISAQSFLAVALTVLAGGPAAYAASAGEQQQENSPMIEVETRQNIRVVYDVKEDVWDAGIGKGLYYVRGLLEAYKDMRVPPEALQISVVLHGPTTYWLVNEEAFQTYKDDPFAFNPNTKGVQELIDHGVSVEACYVTMKRYGWTAKDLLPGVKIVHDGYTRMIDLQQRGYGYIHF
jgi:uncharacterized protein